MKSIFLPKENFAIVLFSPESELPPHPPQECKVSYRTKFEAPDTSISLVYTDEATVQSPSYQRVSSSDVSGSGPSLSCCEKHEGNYMQPAGFMS